MRALWILVALCSVAVAAPKKHDAGAMVIVLDRSGSMQGPKLEAVREATRAIIETLEATDEVAVIAFDSDASVLIPLQKVTNKKTLQAAMKELKSGGGTNILPGLQEAKTAVHASKLKLKHVIVLTDGEAPSDGIAEVAKSIAEDDHATISSIGVAGADRNILSLIADAGGGRLYMVEDLGSIPKIFLKEIKAAFKR